MWNMLTPAGVANHAHPSVAAGYLSVWGGQLLQISREQSKTVDALLFGRTSYEIMSEYWSSRTGEIADLMNGMPKIVFSRTLKRTAWSNTRLVTIHPGSEVARMKRQPGRDLLLLGASTLSSLLVQQGLVDEWRLAVSPVVPSAGDPGRAPDGRCLSMTLLETRRLSSGCLIVRYASMRRPGSRSSRGARPPIAQPLVAPRQRASAIDGPFAETKEWLLASAGPRDRG